MCENSWELRYHLSLYQLFSVPSPRSSPSRVFCFQRKMLQLIMERLAGLCSLYCVTIVSMVVCYGVWWWWWCALCTALSHYFSQHFIISMQNCEDCNWLVVTMKGLEMNLANTPSTSGVHCTGIILRNLFLFVTSNGVCLLSRLPVIIYYESKIGTK